MNNYKVGQRIRCISDNAGMIEPGTILIVKQVKSNHCTFIETIHVLYFDEIEPLNRTIRDVKEGEIVFLGDLKAKILATGEHGFVRTKWNKCDKYLGVWFTWEQSRHIKIKQQEQEKQGIEIAEELEHSMTDFYEVMDNRNLIIELQKLVNKIVKE